MSLIHQELLKSIVSIGIKDRNKITLFGTGVLINFDNFVIISTLKSVIDKASTFDDYDIFFSSSQGQTKSKKYSQIKKFTNLNWIYHPNEKVDLAVNFFLFNPRKDDVKVLPQKYFFIDDNIDIGTEAYYLSFFKPDSHPESLIPIVRRGNLAGKSNSNKFFLEFTVFDENLGSPVFILPTFMTTSGRMITGQSHNPRIIGFINSNLERNNEKLFLSNLVKISCLNDIFSTKIFKKIISDFNKPYKDKTIELAIKIEDIFKSIISIEVTDDSDYVDQLYDIFMKNRSNFLKMGFNYKHNDDSILDHNFWVHFTKRGKDNKAYQFLVRKLDNGNLKVPDDAFFSGGYSQEMKTSNNNEVLKEFVQYLKQLIK